MSSKKGMKTYLMAKKRLPITKSISDGGLLAGSRNLSMGGFQKKLRGGSKKL
jgi:hypothetical protein